MRRNSGLVVLGLLLAPLPGLLILMLPVALSHPAALPFGLIGSAVIGYPFAFFVFAPTVLFLGMRWRLTWWSTALAGFASVLCVGVAHCIVTGHLATGFSTDIALAACSGVAGFCFWLIVGDFGGRDRSSRISRSV